MNTWAMNLSLDQYEKYIVKKNFVNEVMSYNIQTIPLPKKRIFIKMTIDVFGMVPTITAMKHYLKADVDMDLDTLDIGHQLTLKIDEQYFTSITWLPNVVDHCLSSLRDNTTLLHYFKEVFSQIPSFDRRFIVYQLDPEAQKDNYQIEYDNHLHTLSLISKGLIDVVETFEGEEYTRLRARVIDILNAHIDIIHIFVNRN